MAMNTVELCMHLEDLPQGLHLNFLIVSVTGTGHTGTGTDSQGFSPGCGSSVGKDVFTGSLTPCRCSSRTSSLCFRF